MTSINNDCDQGSEQHHVEDLSHPTHSNEVSSIASVERYSIIDEDYEVISDRTTLIRGETLHPEVSIYGSTAAATRPECSCSETIGSETIQTDTPNDKLRLLQAQVFIEDAAEYRSINHKVEFKPLKFYQLYHSKPILLLRHFVIFLLHMLAFFEFPSSLTRTSDVRDRGERIEFPCGVTEGIELFCLLFLLADVVMKSHIYGYQYLRINRWLSVEVLVLGISLIDWAISVGFGCGELVRFRRMLRPVFIIQNSSLMKKILNSLRKTMSQILGVLLLMALHVYIFSLFAMLLFPKPKSTKTPSNTIDGLDIMGDPSNGSSSNNTQNGAEAEYFRTLTGSFMSLLVLLTTANNPDVTLPAYRRNRFYSLFFIVFLFIGLYCFMNMLTAIIFTQFRGYFLSSLRSSLLRRRLGQRAAFESLKRKNVQLSVSSPVQGSENDVPRRHTHRVAVRDLKLVISRAKISQDMKIGLIQSIARDYNQDKMLNIEQFQSIFLSVESDRYQKEKPSIRWFRHHSRLVALQKFICHRYFSYFGNLMALVNVVLITIELATEYDNSLSDSKSVLRIINFLFIFYYVIEQSLILVCMGWRRYVYSNANIIDGIIVTILLISEVVTVALYGFPFFSNHEVHNNLTLWNFVRVINVLIMVRLLRIIWHIKAMAIVAHTLFDLVKNLQSFGGILVVIYYFFAILGMELFHDAIKYNSDIANKSEKICGTYEQLDYWANNFDDFFAALVVLWDVMVVNNWFVFLDAYAAYTTKWSYLYFIVWWLISVVLTLSLFTALIIENFTMKWDRFHQSGNRRSRSRSASTSYDMNTLTVHDIFRQTEQEPKEDEIQTELNNLTYFRV